MISGMRVKNLRGIKDSGLIRFRKINVVVGRNSAGKSTLLRTLPLLRQSVEQSTKGPILWYGRLVDFGSFGNAVRKSSVDSTISIEFEASLQLERIVSRNALALFGGRAKRGSSRIDVLASVCLGDGHVDEVGRLSRISLSFKEDVVQIDFQDSRVVSLLVNGQEVSLGPTDSWWTPQGKILPSIHVLREEAVYTSDGAEESAVSFLDDPFDDWFAEGLDWLGIEYQSDDKVRASIVNLPYAGADDYFKSVRLVPDLPHHAIEKLESDGPNGAHVFSLRTAALLNSLKNILGALDSQIASFAESVRYVEPLRATAERYYRLQDLAVDEVDSRGGNVAMFLNSLEYFEKIELRNWMRENLGFEVQVTPGAGHVEVKIAVGQSDATNIADLGFGYSQMLPIVLQLWRSLVSPRIGARLIEKNSVVAIEQPELHLHPQYQALLADVMAAALADSEVDKGMIFAETHSEHLVNRLGELVAEKKLSPNDVQVIVVERGDTGDSTVKCVDFTAAGFLGAEWPVGFFVPRVENAVLD